MGFRGSGFQVGCFEWKLQVFSVRVSWSEVQEVGLQAFRFQDFGVGLSG